MQLLDHRQAPKLNCECTHIVEEHSHFIPALTAVRGGTPAQIKHKLQIAALIRLRLATRQCATVPEWNPMMTAACSCLYLTTEQTAALSQAFLTSLCTAGTCCKTSSGVVCYVSGAGTGQSQAVISVKSFQLMWNLAGSYGKSPELLLFWGYTQSWGGSQCIMSQ